MLFTSREVRIGKNCVWDLEYGPRPQAEGRPWDRGHSFSQYGPTKAGKSSPLVKEKRPLKAGVQFYNTVFKTLDIYFYMYVCKLRVNQQYDDDVTLYEYLFFMVGEMVQNSQSLHSFTFNAVIVIHEYICSHSTTKFTFKKYTYSHLPVYFLFTIIFAHIYEMSSFTFTIEIFIQLFLRTTFAHH